MPVFSYFPIIFIRLLKGKAKLGEVVIGDLKLSEVKYRCTVEYNHESQHKIANLNQSRCPIFP